MNGRPGHLLCVRARVSQGRVYQGCSTRFVMDCRELRASVAALRRCAGVIGFPARGGCLLAASLGLVGNLRELRAAHLMGGSFKRKANWCLSVAGCEIHLRAVLLAACLSLGARREGWCRWRQCDVHDVYPWRVGLHTR